MTSARTKRLEWLLPLLVALVAFLLSRLPFSEGLERRLLDERFKWRGPRPVAGAPFQVVTVDDQSFEVLRQKWPFRPSLYARAIQNLTRAGARLIVFDIEISEPHPLFPEEDSLFAAAIAASKNVILAGKIAYIYGQSLKYPYAISVPPLEVLLEAGAPWGLVNELTDSDDFSRRYLISLPIDHIRKPSLGFEVLRSFLALPEGEALQIRDHYCHFGPLQIPLFDPQSYLINYYGPAGTFPAISFSSILDDSAFDLGANDSNFMERFYGLPPGGIAGAVQNPFAGKIVLIGAEAEELHDTKNTPFYAHDPTPRKMAGVEMHAHALQTVLDRAFILRSPPLLVLALNGLLALLIFYGVAWLKPWRGLVISLLLSGCFVVLSFAAFARFNYWLDLTPLLICAVLAYLSTSLFHYFQEKRQRIRIQEMFAHYVPNQVVEELINRPQLLKLGGEKRRLTVLFADIWSFTSISEKMAPEDLVLLLNEYMTAMTEVIHAQAGIIDKYEGDLIMAEFGAPVPCEDHAIRACRAALQMQNRLADLRRQWAARSKPPLEIRIGINTGEVIIGNMGSRDVFDYTVIGDAVNLCARLEKANKVYGTGIMISQFTREQLPADFVTRPLDDLRVRGRREPVRVYELLGENEGHVPAEKRRLLELYRQGWGFYLARDWPRAAAAFDAALKSDPSDHPTRILLDRCREFELHPPAQDWDGAFSVDVP